MAKLELQVPRDIPEHLECKGDTDFARNPLHCLITLSEVKLLVKRVLSCEADVYNFYLRSYSSGKLGFLGSHHQLCVETRSSSGKETLCFFVKHIPYDIPSQAEYVADRGVFDVETGFFREIVPELCCGYKSEQWAPNCYLVKKDLMVFEDLTVKGYSMRDKLFTKELVTSGLTTIARLHASSIIAEERLKTTFKNMYPHLFKEKAFCRSGKSRQWFDAGINATVAIAKHLGLDSSLIPTVCEEVYSAMETSPTKKNVVSHGDLWGNNLMFNNEIPSKCLLVDYQLLRYSPLAHDVAQFLYLCTNRSFREIWEEDMLKHYYSVLCDTLKANQTVLEMPLWSEIVEGMEEQRLSALITANLYFPSVLLNKDTVAQIISSPASYDVYTFQNRENVILENMVKDTVYGERLTEAVIELVELGSRLHELPKPS